MNNEQREFSREWLDLFNQIHIIGTPNPSSVDNLTQFETYTQLILPFEFKEFCQVFGSGDFGKSEIWIDCPRNDTEDYHAEKIDRRETFLLDIEDEDDNYEFLKYSYSFGLGINHISICWDLRTYQDSDQSYDIYLYDDVDNEKYRFGRSFFDFVNDVCIEKKIFENILFESEDSTDPIVRKKAFRCR